MTRTRLSPYRLRRLIAPARGLRRYFFLALAGLLAFLWGLGLCYNLFVQPLVDRLTGSWYRLVSTWVPGHSMVETNYTLGGLMLFGGVAALCTGVSKAVGRLREPETPRGKGGTVEAWSRRQILAAGPRVVAIGGGTGLSTLLRGLKRHTSNITAIVTVTDDGGSSGRLVKEMGIMPPGDIRNCLVALADAEKLMTDLFQHRFKGKSGSLSGHSLGNLLIAGLIDQSGGDMDRALEMASEVLAIRGRVVPSTQDSVRLRALMEDGTEICGETAIVASGKRIRRVFLDPPGARAHEEALQAIAEAELLCIGPGSVYTSVIPNLLVPGIAAAIEACPARKVYICNVMTQHGESDAFTATEHLLAIQANVEPKVADYVVINVGLPSQTTLEKYRGYEQDLVVPDFERAATMGYKPIIGDFISETDYVRHDPLKLAERLMGLV